MPFSLKSALPALAALLAACGGQSRQTSSPHSEATVTSAYIKGHHVEKIMVADEGTVAIVDREGCLAQVKERSTAVGPAAEILTRCPKPERMASWFDQSDRVTDVLVYEPLTARPEGDESEALDDKLDLHAPTAKVLVSNGKMLRVAKPADVAKLTAQVRALSDACRRRQRRARPCERGRMADAPRERSRPRDVRGSAGGRPARGTCLDDGTVQV